jgi:enoyl-CoA hydratase
MFTTITLDGPGKNSLSTPMMQSVIDRIAAHKDEPLLLVGNGDAFCAGLNLKEVASLDEASMHTFVLLVERMMVALFDHPAPTVACVNGHAIAGGCILALCCDHRVSVDSPSVRIGVNELALGLVFPPKIMRIVKHRVPPRSLHEVVLRSRLVSPQDALRMGLIDELAADPRVIAEERIRELASLPRPAYIAAKRALREGVTTFQTKAYEAELAAILPAWTDPRVKELVTRQLSKSGPRGNL